jgi:site-specific DNA-methyltransferase (adenine-specific)
MPEPFPKNLLCYGDNLVFLSDPDLFPNESVDLIYLDPPFNSQQSYNVLFKEATGAPEAAQIKAFEDTWNWDMEANKALTRILQDKVVPPALAEIDAFFRRSGKGIVALTVKEIFDKEIAKKLA